jgi:hypothetical protein
MVESREVVHSNRWEIIQDKGFHPSLLSTSFRRHHLRYSPLTLAFWRAVIPHSAGLKRCGLKRSALDCESQDLSLSAIACSSLLIWERNGSWNHFQILNFVTRAVDPLTPEIFPDGHAR